MNRLITVLKITFLGFLLLNLLTSIILFLDSAIEGTKMSWEYLQYVTIYGMIVSIIFGYMDRPILEKRLLIGISICSVILFITSLFIDNQMFRSQAIYLFYGIVIGRKMVLFVDMKFKKNRKK